MLFYPMFLISCVADAFVRLFWYDSNLSLTKEVSMRAVAKRSMALLVSLIFVGGLWFYFGLFCRFFACFAYGFFVSVV